MTTAIVYIPTGVERDLQFARECIDHMDRRGYQNGGIYRTMEDVRRALNRGATLVVFARQSHSNVGVHVPSEFVGEETVRLAWSIPPRDRLADRRPSSNGSAAPGEKTEDLAGNVRPRSMRQRNNRAAQLVEDAARRLGFGPSGQQPGWGPAQN